MIRNFLFLANSDYNFLLRTAGTKEARMKRVAMLRRHAVLLLAEAVKRVPVEKPSILAAYRAKGIERVWMLEENNYDAKRFRWELRDFNPTDAETEAAELLSACVAAQEAGDVQEFSDIETGIKAKEQRKHAGKQKRPGGVDPLREKVKKVLAWKRKDGGQLKEALRDWESDRIHGLKLTFDSRSNTYWVEDWDSVEQARKSFTARQMKTYWTG